jgi:hypothetical protein
MEDELFRATIEDRSRSAKPPWRPDSILYPAFFGGPVAAAVLGLINGRRLALPRLQLAAIAGAAVVAFAARLVVTASLDGGSGARLAGTGTGILVWLVVMAVQRRPFRAYSFDGEPSSLVGPGFAAAIGCGLLEAIVIYAVTR